MGMDTRDLWDGDASDDEYTERAPSPEQVVAVEEQLGYRLPGAYVDLAKTRNGGRLRRNAHPSPPTTWASDHVVITGIFAIGRHAPSSLCGRLGQRLWLQEWGYPAFGVYFADTPSAGHDLVALDYRECGPRGEPRVVHVDQEAGYVATPLAPNFSDFLGGLVLDSEVHPDTP